MNQSGESSNPRAAAREAEFMEDDDPLNPFVHTRDGGTRHIEAER